MPSFRYGGKTGKRHNLVVSSDYVALRTADREVLESDRLSQPAWEAMAETQPAFRLAASGVEVHRIQRQRGKTALRDRVRGALMQDPEVEWAGRVLCDHRSRAPVLYTENMFVKFADQRAERYCRKVIRGHGLTVKRKIPYLRNGFFVGAPEGSGLEVFDAAERLLAEEWVELCHPELVREVSWRGAFPEQWHLKKTTIGSRSIDQHANVEGAWRHTMGEGIVIAVVDDGVDIDHEEFASPGKVVAPRNATDDTDDPRPGEKDDHGTACAGVACGDGLHHASGVAPKANLMPVRLKSGLGSQQEADALQRAAENGADVISCSWGPKDGDWRNPSDPLHAAVHPLPDSTRLALDWVVENGRGGRGCVITWSAGNGNESVDNDGYASYEKVMAVAACGDAGRRCPYSDFGDAVWCCFPSNDPESTATRGIWTTDRSGAAGYNPRSSKRGDREGNYTNRFGGTSSACPGVAGVAALVLAANPELTWSEVRGIIRDSCRKIDPAGGAYDGNGHSRLYGYGRVDAEAAVLLAQRAAAAPRAMVSRSAAPRLSLARRAVDRVAVKVRVETEASSYWLRIDDRPLNFTRGVAPINLVPGETYILSWWFGGEPAAAYSIELDAGRREVRGRFPVRRRIARDSTKSAGTRKFALADGR